MTDALLDVGKQCALPLCNLVDFLPFKCQHCMESFCQDHFKVEAHSCQHYDETKFNRVAQNCPVCNTPIPSPPGEDPNIRMDRHLETECNMKGKFQKSAPRCQTCKKILFSPIRCDNCNHQFCATHRFPGDHTCNAQPTSVNQRTKPPFGSPKFFANLDAASKKLKASAAPAANRQPSVPTVNVASSSPAAEVAGSSSKPKVKLPFNQTERPSVSVSFPSDITTTISAVTTTDDTPNINITRTESNSDSFSNKPHPAITASSFIPRPIFATA